MEVKEENYTCVAKKAEMAKGQGSEAHCDYKGRGHDVRWNTFKRKIKVSADQ